MDVGKGLKTESVGKSVPRIDGVAKVTGQAVYTSDMVVPNMAYGKLLLSPFAHAFIRGIDTHAAENMPGVLAVLTGERLAKGLPSLKEVNRFGFLVKDRPVLAVDRVRFEGEPVAAVVATDEETAARAVQAIEVDYEPLTAVTDVVQAVERPPATVFQNEHDEPPRQVPWIRSDLERNICHHSVFEHGDVSYTERPHQLIEDEFTFPPVYHYSMEPHAVLAEVKDGKITVHSSTQAPFRVRWELAETFGVPPEDIRVIVPYIGGAFGSKAFMEIEPLAVALSDACGRPVRLVLSVEEAARVVRRNSAVMRIRSGVDEDGTILFRTGEVYVDTGAYADTGPLVARKIGYHLPGPYKIPYVRVEVYCVYTNTVPAGSFRGFGGPQAAWAYESHTEHISRRLGQDSEQFRMKHLLEQGDEYSLGGSMDGSPKEIFQEAARAFSSLGSVPVNAALSAVRRRGVGMACTLKDCGAARFEARVRLEKDGTFVLHANLPEIGTGAATIMKQLVAERLSIDVDRILVMAPDTERTPFSFGLSGSRTTIFLGTAVDQAAKNLREKIIEVVAKRFDVAKSDIFLSDDGAQGNAQHMSFSDIAHHCDESYNEVLIGEGTYEAEPTLTTGEFHPITWEINAAKAEIEVDVQTGEVRLLRYAAAADAGKAIHPLHCEGQEQGSIMFGIGHTLFEEQVFESGHLLNDGLVDYTVPRVKHLPNLLRTVMVEKGNGPGPYGAKPISEGGVGPVAPSIAAALCDATGVRAKDLPLTPERVFSLLSDKSMS